MTKIRKALPKNPPHEEKAKKTKPKTASKKETGKGTKPRYSYPQEAFGKKKDAPAMEPAEGTDQGQIPPPPPRVPEPLPVNPAKFAAQTGLSLETWIEVAERFRDSKHLDGQEGFCRFLGAKLREMNEKHGLDQSYFGRLYDALLTMA